MLEDHTIFDDFIIKKHIKLDNRMELKKIKAHLHFEIKQRFIRRYHN